MRQDSALDPNKHYEALTSEQQAALWRLSTTPLLLFGTVRVDPFDSLPFELNRSDEMLLESFSRTNKWPWCPINLQSCWWPLALADELVLHVTLYIWSWSFRRSVDPQAVTLPPEIYAHKITGISLINSRLSEPTQAVTDETISAVAAMTTMEVMTGTWEEASKHMNGLRILVAMRGGYSTFTTSLQHLIQRLISWTDLIYSELFEVPLNFPTADIYEASYHGLAKAASASPLGLSPAELRTAGVPHHEVIDLLHATHQLCQTEQVKPLRSLDEMERMKRGDMCHSVERRLRTIIHAQALSESDNRNSTVWRTVACANLIFVHHFLRGNSPRHRQFTDSLVPTLHESLLQIGDCLEELGFALPLLLWLLSVGAIVGVATSLQPWFVQKLAEACKRHSVEVWHGENGFHSVLSRFLWTGAADEHRYLGLWRMVGLQFGNVHSGHETLDC